MTQLYLKVSSARTQRTICLNDVSVVTIGRHPGNLVKLEDDRASRNHCVIEEHNGKVTVTDLRSRNGTFLNGRKVRSEEMRPGDTLRVGSIKVELVAEPDSAAAPPPQVVRVQSAPPPEVPAAPPPRNVPAVAPPRGRDDPAAPLESEPQPLKPPSLQFSEEDEAQEEEALRRGLDLGGVLAPGGEDVPYSADVADREEGIIRELLAKLPGTGGAEDRLQLINARGQQAASGGGGEQGPVVILRLLLAVCDRARASDLHLEPKREGSGVRIRVDGMMIEVQRLHRGLAQRLANVVKVLCDLDIARSNVVQEGRFSSRMGHRRVEYRVSFAPSVFGQTLAIRVLDPAHAPQFVRHLGMPPWIAQNIQQVVRQDAGMLIVCGPTGSGKSTTLYAVVREIDTHSRKVITIEDPPEFNIEGATQMGVSEAQGNTFSSLLRSILRQDPDVIFVGEIRDAETARMALQAASTGHLVLTTVHARDAIGSIYRLLDLGVEASLIASALNLVLAQRLVRHLCPHCRGAGRPPFEQISKAGRAFDGVNEVYHAVGCPRCINTGYAGRVGMFELLNTTEDLRDAIVKAPTVQQLRKALQRTMFSSLRDSGYQLVARGITSLDEVERVLGID